MPASLKLQEEYGDQIQVIFVESQGATGDAAEKFAFQRKWLSGHSMWTTERPFDSGSRGLPNFVLLSNDGEVLLKGNPMAMKGKIEDAIAAEVRKTKKAPADTPKALEKAWKEFRKGEYSKAITAAQKAATKPEVEEDATAAAELLGNLDTVAVVTGQQAGLFGGPLYTLLKAISAIRLARQVEARHGVPTVAVFWVDAEDHDLDEISSCSVLTSDLELRTVTISHESVSLQPASKIRLPDTITNVTSELRELLPNTEFTSALFEELTTVYRPGMGIVEAFSRWMDTLLGPHGLIVFDGSDPNAKPITKALLERELDTPGETSRLAQAAGKNLTTLGYHAQVTPDVDAVALFYLGDGRQGIRLQTIDPTAGAVFDIGTKVVPGNQLRSELSERPEAFSPNVLLRPVVQDAMFPTVATVAGPSELAYLGQLRDVYRHFGVPMPIIYPRVSGTLVDQAALRFLDRYRVDFEMLQAQDDKVLNRLLATLLPDAVERTIGDTERAIGERLVAVAAEVSALDPTLTGVVETTRSRMDRDLKTLRNKIIKAAKRRDETLSRQYHRARSQAFPNGDPQERAVGLIYFLNRYGPQLVDHLLDNMALDIGKHGLLTV
mgnify:CR=1 FL=1